MLGAPEALQWRLLGAVVDHGATLKALNILAALITIPPSPGSLVQTSGVLTFILLGSLQLASLLGHRAVLSSNEFQPVTAYKLGVHGRTWVSLFLTRVVVRGRTWSHAAATAAFFGTNAVTAVVYVSLYARLRLGPAAAGWVSVWFGLLLAIAYSTAYLLRCAHRGSKGRVRSQSMPSSKPTCLVGHPTTEAVLHITALPAPPTSGPRASDVLQYPVLQRQRLYSFQKRVPGGGLASFRVASVHQADEPHVIPFLYTPRPLCAPRSYRGRRLRGRDGVCAGRAVQAPTAAAAAAAVRPGAVGRAVRAVVGAGRRMAAGLSLFTNSCLDHHNFFAVATRLLVREVEEAGPVHARPCRTPLGTSGQSGGPPRTCPRCVSRVSNLCVPVWQVVITERLRCAQPGDADANGPLLAQLSCRDTVVQVRALWPPQPRLACAARRILARSTHSSPCWLPGPLWHCGWGVERLGWPATCARPTC
jgi:hypothetical protein